MSDIIERLRALPILRQLPSMTHAKEAADEIERLQAAAERVCWFDWSDNDDDAVAAIEALRRALEGK